MLTLYKVADLCLASGKNEQIAVNSEILWIKTEEKPAKSRAAFPLLPKTTSWWSAALKATIVRLASACRFLQ